MAVRTPFDYQRDLRDFALDNRRVNWWAGTGTGKTGSAIETFDHLRMFGEVNKLLVVSTKRVASMVWTNELAKWENFEHLSIATAIGTPDQRIAAIRARADITTINYDNLPWLIEKMGDEWPWDMVIPDESTKIKSLRIDVRTSSKGKVFARQSGGGGRAYKLATVAHKKARYWINMTGTPAPNGLIDVWGQQYFVDAGARLGRTFTSFKDRWFNSIRAKGDDHRIILQPTPFADAQIKAAMADCTLTIEAKDYFDLPPLVKNVISIRLPPKAYAHYREMEKEMFTKIKNKEIEAFNAGAKSMKCRQLASGAAYVEPDDGSDTKQWVEVHAEKLDALEDIVAEERPGPPQAALPAGRLLRRQAEHPGALPRRADPGAVHPPRLGRPRYRRHAGRVQHRRVVLDGLEFGRVRATY